MNREFWRGKKVLLTGHTGFKGAWLSTWLKLMGAQLVGYSLAPPPGVPGLFDEARVGEGMVSIIGDIRDLDHLRRVVSEYAPEIIIHMAAQAIVRQSYVDPVFTYTTNVIGTMNVLEAARQAKDLRVVVMVTSDKAYANHERVWAYRESDRLGGRDPYSSSKACAELVIQAYRQSYFPTESLSQHNVAIASARAGNVIGGGDWSTDRLIPDILRALASERPVMIRSPNSIRPWQFVLEAVGGYLLLAERLWSDGDTLSEEWNFGPDVDDVRPVSWIADYLVDRWGQGAAWVKDDCVHPPEANLLMLDCTKAKRLLGWRPRLRLPTTLDWIIDWNRAWLNGKSSRLSVETQINDFERIE